MVKFKVFQGSLYSDKAVKIRADDAANRWLAANPDVRVLQMSYSQGGHADGAICIMYDEKSPAELDAEIARLSQQISFGDALSRALAMSLEKYIIEESTDDPLSDVSEYK